MPKREEVGTVFAVQQNMPPSLDLAVQEALEEIQVSLTKHFTVKQNLPSTRTIKQGEFLSRSLSTTVMDHWRSGGQS